MFAAARDVTDQKALEQQLREQQTYLRGLIESSVDGLVTVDQEGFISDVNDRMCEMTDYGRAELIGTRFADYFTEPDLARAGVQQTFEAGFVTEYALTLISRTRRHLRVSFNASVFKGPDGDVRGIFASARDITDRVRLEEQLRGAADVPARPDRVVGGRPGHGRPGRVHHRCQRADVPDGGL